MVLPFIRTLATLTCLLPLATPALAGPLALTPPDGMFAARPAEIQLTGGLPGATAVVVSSARGPGAGPCPPALDGACFGLVGARIVGLATLDASGAGTLRLLPSRDVPNGRVWLQAAMGDGVTVALSGVHQVPVISWLRDTDGDGARDVIEHDRGLDRFLPDSDGDGLLDGVDVLPLTPSTPDPFVADDVLVSDPSRSLPDPEFDPVSQQFAWQDLAGREVWVGSVDPATGGFLPPDGRGQLVTRDISPVSVGKNGPEWVLTARGSEVLYIDDAPDGTWRPHVAWQDAAGWHPEPVVDGPEGDVAFGTMTPGDPTPRLIVHDADPQATVVRDLFDPTTRVDLPVPLLDGRWVEDLPLVAGVGSPGGRQRRQVALVDPATRTYVALTIDDLFKYSVRMWRSPEWGGDLGMVVTQGTVQGEYTQMAVYRQQGAAWTQVALLQPPAGQPYVISPEVFTWAGRSYVSFLASERPTNSDDGLSSVWIGALDPATPLLRRVSEPVVDVRKDPEFYTGGQRPWVYYTVVSPSQHRAIRRAELGL